MSSKEDFIIEDGILLKYIGIEETIVIPDGIIEIGKNAFDGNGTIREVVIPESVESIAKWAFCRCKNLQRIALPSRLKSIGHLAFNECGIQSVTIPGTVKMDEGAFYGCPNLKKVILQEGIEDTGNSTFQACTLLKSVTLPSTVRMIGEGCFADNKKLADINLPEGLETIGEIAFRGCALKKIVIPKSVKKFGKNAFAKCKFKTAGPISSGCDYEFPWEDKVPQYAFIGLKNLETVKLPNSIKEIGISAFADCKILKTVNVSPNARIGKNAFKGCTGLVMDSESVSEDTTHFTIVNGILSAYSGTERKVVIPDGVTKIGNRVFYFKAVETVVIPSRVETIEKEAFAYTGLKHAEILGAPKKIGQDAFDTFGYKITPLLMDIITKVPLTAFNNNNRLEMFVAFIKTCNESGYNASVTEKNWKYIRDHLKEFEYSFFADQARGNGEAFGELFRREMIARRNFKDSDYVWLIDEANRRGMTALVAELLECRNQSQTREFGF